jgi:hypothetical protein
MLKTASKLRNPLTSKQERRLAYLFAEKNENVFHILERTME